MTIPTLRTDAKCVLCNHGQVMVDANCARQLERELAAMTARYEAAARMTPGCAAIVAERHRQIEKEGWTPEHDDEHTLGQLAAAAATYAHPKNRSGVFVARWWPWDWRWWKPSPENRKRELEKAGALIAAEWDRLDREEKAKPTGKETQ